MKKIFAICLFSAFVLTVCGRNVVSFAYDAAGNRVKREIVMSRSMSADDSDNHEENTFFDTLTQRTVKLTATTGGLIKIEILGFESSDNAIAALYSIDGIMLLSQPVKNAIIEIDISERPSGTYVLSVSVNGQQTTWKIAK